jgi:catechol 2,3-dioxygenase-like lactoylglutathione lyase family enzyme
MIGRRLTVEELNFKLTQIGIVMLGVQQMEQSMTFYRDKLGLVFKGQNEGFAFLDGGGVTLCLSEPLARASGGQMSGAVEVVFSVEDVRAAHQALAARGVKFTHEPRNVTGPLWAANFDDPDGHHLSIFGPETKA